MLEIDLLLPLVAGDILELVFDTIEISDKSDLCLHNLAGLFTTEEDDNFRIRLLGLLVTLINGANKPWLALHSKYLFSPT